MSTLEHPWRPGRQLSLWPELKYARAREHFAQVGLRLSTWAAGNLVTTRKQISKDGLRVDVILDVTAPPPLNELSLALGDGIHNLRSALDAVVWELANLNGKTPNYPRRVQFPVCSGEKSWKEATKYLETVPECALRRIHSFQPYVMREAGAETCPLETLHSADVHDKHKAQLEFGAYWNRIVLESCTLLLADSSVPESELKFSAEAIKKFDIRDGETLVRLHASHPVVDARIPLNITVNLSVEFDGRRVPLNEFQDSILVGVREILDALSVESSKDRSGGPAAC